MYDELRANWENDDKIVDIIGFSRGAALALHFANKLGKNGIELGDGTKEDISIRFLGLWDVVGSFGLSFDTFVNFQDINLGWDIDEVSSSVKNCFHAMALDERRETFCVTRLNREQTLPNVYEMWFRGAHSDIGGGNSNESRSNIALQWMLDQARACNLRFNETSASLPHYSHTDPFSPIYENQDVKVDRRRDVRDTDHIHPSAPGRSLQVGESQKCQVHAAHRFNWSGVQLDEGAVYTVSAVPNAEWFDGGIACGPAGWDSDQLSWYKEPLVECMERFRRLPEKNWFALIGALGDDHDNLVFIGDKATPFTAAKSAEFYLFANDLNSKYDNNRGMIELTITRLS
jgi:hypothetical protein